MRHILAITFILFIVLGLCSCSEQRMLAKENKQANKKVSWLLARGRMPSICATLYPNVDSITKGDTITNFDTLYLDNEVYIRDTVTKDGQTIYIEKKCPPHKTITVTKFLHDTVYRTNTATIEEAKSHLLKMKKMALEAQDIMLDQQKQINKNTWWKIAALITWFAIVLGFVFRFFIIKKPL